MGQGGERIFFLKWYIVSYILYQVNISIMSSVKGNLKYRKFLFLSFSLKIS